MRRRKTESRAPAGTKLCWAIVPIDGQPIRDKARREYQKVRRDLDRVRRDLEQFEQMDQPLFDRWLHRQFGALLTELREVSAKLRAQRDLLFEIQTESFLSDCSHTRAYERVMWRREHPQPEPDDVPNEAEPGGARDFADAFKAAFEQFQNGFANAFGSSDNTFSSAPGAPRPMARRLKELYRALARRLHPDILEKACPQKAEWWHQVQAAYENGDADQLQSILTLCEIEEQGITAHTSVSLLLRVTRQLKSSLRTLRLKLNQHRRQPAWNFSQSDHTALARTLERSMQVELAELKYGLRAVEAQIASWARQAQASHRRPARRRTAPRRPEFLF